MMHGLGVDTDLVTTIKQMLDNPISPLLEIKNDVDSSIGEFITLLVKSFLRKHTEIVHKACRTAIDKTTELHFSIVLKEDNSDNRSLIFKWLREYKETPIWEVYPVYFQFVPENIITFVKSKEVIIGDA